MFTKKKCVLSILVILSMFLISHETNAKSIYAITSHPASEISAYKIDDNELMYQIEEQFSVSGTRGAVGLTLDSNSEVLFVSYDEDGVYALSLINAKTMELIETKYMDYEFGGLSFNTTNNQLYDIISCHISSCK